jgi:putative inorganic carbon (hco3(-)) transporter
VSGDEQHTENRLLFGLFLGLLAWIPWPLGSNRPWSWALLETGVFTLLALWCLSRCRRRTPIVLPEGAPLLLKLGGWACLWVLFQVLPLPAALIEHIQPASHSAYYLAPGAQAWMPLTVDVGSTLTEFLKLSAYVGAFALTVILVRGRRRALIVLGVLVATATAEALYGITVRLTGAHLGLWDPGFTANAVSGTYVNRNHFAGLMVLCVGLCAGAALQQRGEGVSSFQLRLLLERVTRWMLGPQVWLMFPTVVLLGGLILSTSRGGVAACLGAVMAVAAMGGGRARVGRALGMLTVVAGIAVFWLGSGDMLPSLAEKGISSNRGDLARMTLDLIAQSPFFGGGAGTFEWRFPAVRTQSLLDVYYHHAHNDYLELIADVGLIGVIPFVVGVIVVFKRLIGGVRGRRDLVARTCVGGALVATIGALLHAIVDFNFHIPANATYFFVIVAIGLVAADSNTMRHR